MRLSHTHLAFRLIAFVAMLMASLSASSFSGLFPGQPSDDPWAHQPNDPDYSTEWDLFSHIPPDQRSSVSAAEESLGSGNHVDRAWQYHVGAPKMLVAVLDSGVFWESPDIAEQFFINPRELPLPQGSETYDVNGDGRISASDYARDGRVGDRNSNGRIDPEDLIMAFSDGRDDDQNGFVDDISGWDFHEHDNNPNDRTRFGHGTGEAKDSVAGLNNGQGGAGICGNCSVIFMRVNDSFVIDANAFARAVMYATDIGATVVQAASGSINHSPFVKDAAQYAYERGTLIIGSAADENSFHHNYPATIDPIIYVNSIRYDAADRRDATTFLNFNNCSNYGARVDVSAASLSCSSEATGKLSGIASLALSYADQLGTPLTPGEMISLIKTRANDINRGVNTLDQSRHSTYSGWDTITGYGRVNAGDMMKSLHDQNIPPEARITSPDWFAVFRKSRTPSIPVGIALRMPRSGHGTFRLEVARGVETAEAVYAVVAEGVIEGTPKQDTLIAIPTDLLSALIQGPHNESRYKDAFTARLTIDDGNRNVAEARRTFFLFDDPTLRDGFPVKLNGSGESAGVFFDLNGDTKEEFVTADGAGFIHAFTLGGRELPGFPARTVNSRYAPSTVLPSGPVYSSIFAPVAVGDLAGLGHPQIVAVSLEGDLSVKEANGEDHRGFPVTLPFPDMSASSGQQVIAQGVFAAPVLADLDGDGTLEIILAAMDGQIHAYRHDGNLHPGFPVAILQDGVRAKLNSSPAVYDLDQDGALDLVFGTNHVSFEAGLVFAISGKGALAPRLFLPGFPVKVPLIRNQILPMIGTGIAVAPAIGDVDGDGTPEIFVHGFASKGYLISFDGQLKRSLGMTRGQKSPSNDDAMISGFGQPGLADLDGNGVLDPVTLGAGRKILLSLAMAGKRIPYDHLLGAWNGRSGEMLVDYPKINDDTAINPSPVFADLNHDGKQDVIFGSGGYYVHGASALGELDGFPKFTGGWTLGAPALGDLDGDGLLELAATTREGYLFIWQTRGSASQPRSGMTFKGNSQRSGLWKGF